MNYEDKVGFHINSKNVLCEYTLVMLHVQMYLFPWLNLES